MTYLEIVNRVLRRMRETEVTTVQETPYSILIGDLVNVVKREVEDTWDWDALRTTLTATTQADLFNYVLAGGSNRTRLHNIVNDTSNWTLQYRDSNWFDKKFLMVPTEAGSPQFWTVNGVSENGDTQIDLFPIPDGEYLIRFNGVFPPQDLEADTDRLLVNPLIVIEGTIARAISERGEDGGYQEQEQRYNRVLSDLIAIEANRRCEEITWQGV